MQSFSKQLDKSLNMDINLLNNNAICCFCGQDVSIKDAVVLNIQAKLDIEEVQQFLCHKEHLKEHLHESVKMYLNLDFFE